MPSAELIDIYYALFLAEPVMRDIWSGTQADKALRDIDLDDSRQTGSMLAAVLERLRPEADRAAIATKAFLIMNLGEATMRLAISVERQEGDALVAAFKQMALREFSADGLTRSLPALFGGRRFLSEQCRRDCPTVRSWRLAAS